MTDEQDTREDGYADYADGYVDGYLHGFDAGVTIGRDQGYEDCLYRIKRMAEDIFDPDLEKAIKALTGEE